MSQVTEAQPSGDAGAPSCHSSLSSALPSMALSWPHCWNTVQLPSWRLLEAPTGLKVKQPVNQFQPTKTSLCLSEHRTTLCSFFGGSRFHFEELRIYVMVFGMF